jgi:hypothetical protein
MRNDDNWMRTGGGTRTGGVGSHDDRNSRQNAWERLYRVICKKMGSENARVVGAFAERWITAGETVSGVHSPWLVYIVQGWSFPLVGLHCAGVVIPLGWFTLCRGRDQSVVMVSILRGTQGGRPTEVIHGGVDPTSAS